VGLAAVLVLATVVLAFVAGESTSRTVTVTRTIMLTSSAGGGAVTEEFIVQPAVTNEICVLYGGYQITTYLLRATGNTQEVTTTVTETSYALNTITIYENVTIFSSGSACTEINPHYQATQTPPCGPCG